MKYKIYFLPILFFSAVQAVDAQIIDSIIDGRDGQVYKTTKIGTQVWMAQNLNFQLDGSWCFENKDANGKTYGRLYSWAAAKNACPTGWHLPSDIEWQELEKYLGMSDEELLKNDKWRGTDQAKKLISDPVVAFNLIYGGYRNPPSNYNLLKMQAFFWTSSDQNGSSWMRQMYSGTAQIFRRTRPLDWAFSVRCLKD